MKTLKLFLLSLICGHPLSFLAEFIRLRLIQSLDQDEERDLIVLMKDYAGWDPRLEESELEEFEDYGQRPGMLIK